MLPNGVSALPQRYPSPLPVVFKMVPECEITKNSAFRIRRFHGEQDQRGRYERRMQPWVSSRWTLHGRASPRKGRIPRPPRQRIRRRRGRTSISPRSPPAALDKHAHGVGVHGRDGAADAQGDVEKPQAKPEQEIGRADDAQVERAEARDVGIVAEQADPQAGLDCDDQADRSAQLPRPSSRRSTRSRGRGDTAARPSSSRPSRRSRCRSRTRSAAGCIRDARPSRSRGRCRVPTVRRFPSVRRPRDW